MSDSNKSRKGTRFDWTGDDGAKFAEESSAHREGYDREWMEFHGVTGTAVLGDIVDAVVKDSTKVCCPVNFIFSELKLSRDRKRHDFGPLRWRSQAYPGQPDSAHDLGTPS